MSLKRRNFFAWGLLAAAALCLAAGMQMVTLSQRGRTVNPTMAATVETALDETVKPGDGQNETEPVNTTIPLFGEENGESTAPIEDASGETENRGMRFGGYTLFFFGVAAGIIAAFVLGQAAPLLGPDGMLLLGAICSICGLTFETTGAWAAFPLHVLFVFVILWTIRELWGWIRAELSLCWCSIHRIAGLCKSPPLALMIFAADIVIMTVAALFLLAAFGARYWISALCAAAAGILGICCLWKYGSDLRYFQIQLERFQNGLPIAVKEGAFARTEEQLQQLQIQHKEAIRTAVTSERFKVELISNVSHDLRTPLTSILGYGELLQREALSPEGRQQLSCLNQKAGYMRDLVESLFELTKVSSGVIECKQEKIDLIRLLEQTIGLFDDQLTAAQLQVRRHYEADAMPVVTDGARMHQVFANLLGNAIKYALSGTRIHLEVKENGESYLVRMVNTASYEMDFQPEEILQRFARGNKARSTQGSGLGLAIAQTYTESVGGSFQVIIDGDQFSAIVQLPKTERNL